MRRRKYDDNDSYEVNNDEDESVYSLVPSNYSNSRSNYASPKYEKDMYYGYYDNYDNNLYITEGNSYFDNYKYYNDEEYFNNEQYDYINYEYGYDRGSVYEDYYKDKRAKRDLRNTYSHDDYYDRNYDDARLRQMYASISSELGLAQKDKDFDNTNMRGRNTSLNNNSKYSDDTSLVVSSKNKNKASKHKKNSNISYEDMFVVKSKYFEEDDDEKLISLKDVINLFVCVVMAFILAFMIVGYVIQHTEVDGTSMEFNYHNEDILLVDKISYRLKDPSRFDVVTFPVEGGDYYIKRIIGLPGEKVLVTDVNYKNESMRNKIFINGEELHEDYGFSKNINWGIRRGDEANCEITLGEDEYFVMGDNRNVSRDSRKEDVGNIKREKIMGKVVFRIYPFDRLGFIEDKDNEDIKINGKSEKGYDPKAKEDGVYVPYTLKKAESN